LLISSIHSEELTSVKNHSFSQIIIHNGDFKPKAKKQMKCGKKYVKMILEKTINLTIKIKSIVAKYNQQ
jgi:hypothetical protein